MTCSRSEDTSLQLLAALIAVVHVIDTEGESAVAWWYRDDLPADEIMWNVRWNTVTETHPEVYVIYYESVLSELEKSFECGSSRV